MLSKTAGLCSDTEQRPKAWGDSMACWFMVTIRPMHWLCSVGIRLLRCPSASGPTGARQCERDYGLGAGLWELHERGQPHQRPGGWVWSRDPAQTEGRQKPGRASLAHLAVYSVALHPAWCSAVITYLYVFLCSRTTVSIWWITWSPTIYATLMRWDAITDDP